MTDRKVSLETEFPMCTRQPLISMMRSDEETTDGVATCGAGESVSLGMLSSQKEVDDVRGCFEAVSMQ